MYVVLLAPAVCNASTRPSRAVSFCSSIPFCSAQAFSPFFLRSGKIIQKGEHKFLTFDNRCKTLRLLSNAGLGTVIVQDAR